MNAENVVKHLRVLWRTDRIIADIRMRHMLVGLGLRAFAALIAAFGLLMLELSAYFALVQIWSAISAAAILGVVNFVIAAILFVIAARPPAGRELELATEIHGASVDALQIEARALQSQVSGVIHHPLNGSSALADHAADHDHHQEPEEAGNRAALRNQPRQSKNNRGHDRRQATHRSDTDMQSVHPKPILNTSLPPQFRQIRIELAREPGHPEGDTGFAYVIVAPLDANDRIDARLWREHREACRIARLRPDQDDELGHLVHRRRRLGVPLRCRHAGRGRGSLRGRTFRIGRICLDQRGRQDAHLPCRGGIASLIQHVIPGRERSDRTRNLDPMRE